MLDATIQRLAPSSPHTERYDSHYMKCMKSPACRWRSTIWKVYSQHGRLHLMKIDAMLVYETYWEVLCHFHICSQTTRLKVGGVKQISWVNYLFQGLGDKIGLVSQWAANTNAEIKKRIHALASSYTTESDENTFKRDTIFEIIIRQGFAFQTGLYWRVSWCFGLRGMSCQCFLMKSSLPM